MTIRKIIIFFLFVFSALSAQSQVTKSYSGFTSQEINNFQSFFEYDINVIAQGGDFSRYVFLNMSEFWPHKVLYSKGKVRSLPMNLNSKIENFPVTSDEKETTLKDYVYNSNVDGIIILHHGQIVFEEYPKMHPKEYHAWFSVSKTLVPTIISKLEEQKQIDINQTVDKYLPQLKGTIWENIKIIDVLNMSSGINCTERNADRFDKNSCFSRFYPGFIRGTDEDVQEDLLKGMHKIDEPGNTYDYTSINTTVLKMIIEKVTGEDYSSLVQNEIWNKIGSESNALMLTSRYSGAQAWLGMSSTLRDLARYGLLFTPTLRDSGVNVVSDFYLKRIQQEHNPKLRNKSRISNEEKYNKYQWDEIYDDGDFMKTGFGGQALYISTSKNLVIAYYGTPDKERRIHQLFEITRQLVKSGIFDE